MGKLEELFARETRTLEIYSRAIDRILPARPSWREDGRFCLSCGTELAGAQIDYCGCVNREDE